MSRMNLLAVGLAHFFCIQTFAVSCLGATAAEPVSNGGSIIPDSTAPSGSPVDDLVTYEVSQWPEDTFFFRYQTDDGVDVTSEAVWSSSGPENAQFIAPGTLVVTTDQPFIITLIAEHPVHGTAEVPLRVVAEGDQSGAGGGGASAPPGQDELDQALQDLQNLLIELGLDGLFNTYANVWANSELEAWYNLWMGGMTSGQDGLYVPLGFVVNGPLLLWQRGDSPSILLADEVVQALVNGEFLTENGVPTSALATLLHEMLHAVIDEEDLQDDFENVDAEEEFVRAFEQWGLPPVFQIVHILKQSEWSIADINNIYQVLKRLKRWIQAIKAKYGDTACTVLEKLGLQDTNGNGIPDIIDQLMKPFLDWLYEWLQNNRWPYPWDPEELFDLFPFYEYEFCENEDIDPIDRDAHGVTYESVPASDCIRPVLSQ